MNLNIILMDKYIKSLFEIIDDILQYRCESYRKYFEYFSNYSNDYS